MNDRQREASLQQPETACLGDRCRVGTTRRVRGGVGHCRWTVCSLMKSRSPDRVIVETHQRSGVGSRPLAASSLSSLRDRTTRRQDRSSRPRAQCGPARVPARPERGEVLDGASHLVAAVSGAPERAHHGGQLHPRTTGLERRPALLEQIDRVLQMLPRGFQVTDRAATRPAAGWPARAAGRCASRSRWRRARRPRAPRRRCGSARRRRGPGAPTPPRVRSGSCRQPPEVPFREVGAGLEIAAIERHAGAPERGQRMGPAALEQVMASSSLPWRRVIRRAAPAPPRSWPGGSPPAPRRLRSAPAPLPPRRRARGRPGRTGCGSANYAGARASSTKP